MSVGRFSNLLLSVALIGLPAAGLFASRAFAQADLQTVWHAQTSRYIEDVKYSPDGASLAVVTRFGTTRHGTISIFRSVDGALLRQWNNYGPITSVAWSADGTMLAAGTGDPQQASVIDEIRVWVLETGSVLRILHGDAGGTWSIAFSPQGRYLATGHFDGYVRLWDLTSGAIAKVIHPGAASSAIQAVGFTNDGETLITGYTQVQLWRVPSGASLGAFPSRGEGIRQIKLSNDGNLMAVALDYGYREPVLQLWDMTTSTIIHTFDSSHEGIKGMDLSPDGEALVVANIDDHLELWRTSDQARVREFTRLEGQPLQQGPNTNMPVAYAPDGLHIAYGRDDGTIAVAVAPNLAGP